MTAAGHVVGRAEVELTFGAVEATRGAAELGRRLVLDLLPAVERAMERAGLAVGDLVVGRIEVDLGAIDAGGVSEADRQRLEQRLLAALLAAGQVAAPTLGLDRAGASPAVVGREVRALWQGLLEGTQDLASVLRHQNQAALQTLLAAFLPLAGPLGEAVSTPPRFATRATLEAAITRLVASARARSRHPPELRRELRAGTLTPAEVVAGRSRAEVERLAEALLDAALGDDGADLRRAIAPRLRRVADPQAFLCAVLARLLEGAALDLDELAATTNAVVEPQPAAPGAARSRPPIDVWRDLEAGKLTVAEVLAEWDDDADGRWVRELVRAAHGAAAGDVVAAIERQLDAAAAPKAFLQDVLTQLLAGRALDLGAAADPPPEAFPALESLRVFAACLDGNVGPERLGVTLARLPALWRRRLRLALERDPGRAAVLLAGRTAVERADFARLLEVPAAAAVGWDDIRAEAGRWLRGGGTGTVAVRTLVRRAPALLRAELQALPDRSAALARLVGLLDERARAGLALAWGAHLAGAWLTAAERAWHARPDARPAAQAREAFWSSLFEPLLAGVTTTEALLATWSPGPGRAPEAADATADAAVYAAYAALADGRTEHGEIASTLAALRDRAPGLLRALPHDWRAHGVDPLPLLAGQRPDQLAAMVDDLLAVALSTPAPELRATLGARLATHTEPARVAADLLRALARDDAVDVTRLGDGGDADGLEAPLPDSLHAHLTGDGAATPLLATLAERQVRSTPGALAAVFAAHPAAVSRCVELLDEADRSRVLYALQGRAAAPLADALAALDLIEAAAPERLWAVLLDTAAVAAPDDVLARFVAAVVRARSAETARTAAEVARALGQRLQVVPASAATRQLRRALDRVAPPAAAQTAAAGWWTGDAGLVLLAVYLPTLFVRGGWLTEGTFADDAERHRAREALRRLVWGRATPPVDGPPDRIGAVLTGLAPDAPPGDAGIETIDAIDPLVESLLQVVLQRWTAVGKTSVSGLREAFLQRPGVIVRRDDGLHLRVEGRAWDVLLDRLPWSYQLVRHRWMPEPLFVQWRP